MLRISPRSVFHDLTGRSTFNAAALAAFVLLGASSVNAQGLPPLDKVLNPAETALILVDFQYPFTNPAGANYHNVQKELDEKHLLDRTVDLVKKCISPKATPTITANSTRPIPAASIVARFCAKPGR
jgi:hypothetical protein